MQQVVTWQAHRMLVLNTLAFTVCFAAWMLNGVLVTYLSSNQMFAWDTIEIGWLIGIPVLTGSLMRLPVGILTDRYGGKPVFTGVLIVSAIPMYLLSHANSFLAFALCSFGFGLVGTSFAVGIAFTSVWYPRHRQGVALGVFGAGNAGAALTTLIAPTLLNRLTEGGAQPEQWRQLPVIYAGVLVAMAVLFVLFSENRKPTSQQRSLRDLLRPLSCIRVWRFGLYYFLVFGCFVAFSQWLIPYFVNAYYLPLVTAGLLASLFSFPSGVIRAFGGWLSDRWGARRVMYWVLGSSALISLALIVPKMDIYSPGRGVMAVQPGTITEIAPNFIRAGAVMYELRPKPEINFNEDDMLIFPRKMLWQVPVVEVGDKIVPKQLLAKGITLIHFQANMWIFALLVFVLGSIWGIGKAAVYRHIPDYFPDEVGVVGGMVGVLGGLGGFFCPILFGYLLEGTGLWTSSWMFVLVLSAVSLFWMHVVVQRMSRSRYPKTSQQLEHHAWIE